jgi:hypothetical protein
MMDLSQRKEQFSRTYVRAVACVAGYTIYQPEVDDDSVDLGIAGRAFGAVPRPPRIELQLKCTADDVIRGDYIAFPLKRKNYDDLRLRDIDLVVPRILVVVRVPESEGEWLHQTEDELLMRRCGYWVSLSGQPKTANRTSVTVQLPRSNRFDVGSLRGLMERASRKEPF